MTKISSVELNPVDVPSVSVSSVLIVDSLDISETEEDDSVVISEVLVSLVPSELRVVASDVLDDPSVCPDSLDILEDSVVIDSELVSVAEEVESEGLADSVLSTVVCSEDPRDEVDSSVELTVGLLLLSSSTCLGISPTSDKTLSSSCGTVVPSTIVESVLSLSAFVVSVASDTALTVVRSEEDSVVVLREESVDSVVRSSDSLEGLAERESVIALASVLNTLPMKVDSVVPEDSSSVVKSEAELSDVDMSVVDISSAVTSEEEGHDETVEEPSLSPVTSMVAPSVCVSESEDFSSNVLAPLPSSENELVAGESE